MWMSSLASLRADEESLAADQPEAVTREPALYEQLALLDSKVALHERLLGEIAARNASLESMRTVVRHTAVQRDELMEQLAALREGVRVSVTLPAANRTVTL